MYFSSIVKVNSFGLMLFWMPMSITFDFRFLHYYNIWFFFLHFRVFWLPAEWRIWGDTITSVCCHPFFPLCCRYVGIWGVVLCVVLKLLVCFGRSKVSSVFKGMPHGTLKENKLISAYEKKDREAAFTWYRKNFGQLLKKLRYVLKEPCNVATFNVCRNLS